MILYFTIYWSITETIANFSEINLKRRINIMLYLQNRKAQLPTTHIHSNVAHTLILYFRWIENQFNK